MPVTVNPEHASTGTETPIKRISMNLPLHTFQELQRLAVISGCTMTEIVRLGVAILSTAREGEQKGLHLAMTTEEGKPVKEFILPK